MTGTKMPFRLSRTALLLAGTTLPSVLSAQTLPTNGTVVAGAAEIAPPAAGTMQITQTSDRAIIEWQDFSVGEGGTVNILQPDVSSALLNRVTGDVTSVIAGTINANGQVYLVNPNGILITKTGTVNAGAFAASTLDIDNEVHGGEWRDRRYRCIRARSRLLTLRRRRPSGVQALRQDLTAGHRRACRRQERRRARHDG